MKRRLRETVLWVGAVLGALCLAWTAVMFAFGLTPLVFTSGSMSPAIEAGDLAFARTIDADQIAVGDVVSVENSKGVRVTHRVVTVDRTDDGAVLSLRGDANATPDAEAYNVTSVERVSFSVPKAGYVVEFVGSPFGMFLGGILVAGTLFLAFGRGQEPTSPGHRETGAARVTTAGIAVVALGLAGATSAVQPTQAAFTDTGTMTAAPAASSVPSQANPSCTNNTVLLGNDTVTLRWNQVDTRYEYTWQLVRQGTGAVASSGTVGAGVAAGSQVEVTVGIAGTVVANYDIVVRARIATSPTWLSAASTSTPVNRFNTIGVGNLECGYA